MIIPVASSFIPSYPHSEIRFPSRKTRWQHAVTQSDLPFHTKGILLIVATEWMNADGASCYPTEEQILAKTGVSRPCLTRHLRIAVERGFIERWRYGRGTHNRRYNYRATFPDEKISNEVPPEIRNEVSDLPAEMGNEVSDLNQDQGSNQKEEASKLKPPQPAMTVSASPLSDSLRAAKTAPPDGVPDAWLAQAGDLRPDLTPQQVRTSAEVFLDHHRAKGTQLVDWLPAWRNWLRKERPPQAAQSSATTPPPASRYPTPEQQKAPVSEAVQRALRASEQRFQALLQAQGIDPTTGLTRTDPPPPVETDRRATLRVRLAALGIGYKSTA